MKICTCSSRITASSTTRIAPTTSTTFSSGCTVGRVHGRQRCSRQGWFRLMTAELFSFVPSSECKVHSMYLRISCQPMFSESFHLQRAGTQELQHRPRKREISHALFRSGELRVSSDPATTAVAAAKNRTPNQHVLTSFHAHTPLPSPAGNGPSLMCASTALYACKLLTRMVSNILPHLLQLTSLNFP